LYALQNKVERLMPRQLSNADRFANVVDAQFDKHEGDNYLRIASLRETLSLRAVGDFPLYLGSLGLPQTISSGSHIVLGRERSKTNRSYRDHVTAIPRPDKKQWHETDLEITRTSASVLVTHQPGEPAGLTVRSYIEDLEPTILEDGQVSAVRKRWSMGSERALEGADADNVIAWVEAASVWPGDLPE
jgi:hypothetical protein